MVVDYDLFDELCFMAVGLHEDFGPKDCARISHARAWDDPAKVLKQHARWAYMHPGAAMIMKTQILHGPAAYLRITSPSSTTMGIGCMNRCRRSRGRSSSAARSRSTCAATRDGCGRGPRRAPRLSGLR